MVDWSIQVLVHIFQIRCLNRGHVFKQGLISYISVGWYISFVTFLFYFFGQVNIIREGTMGHQYLLHFFVTNFVTLIFIGSE